MPMYTTYCRLQMSLKFNITVYPVICASKEICKKNMEIVENDQTRVLRVSFDMCG